MPRTARCTLSRHVDGNPFLSVSLCLSELGTRRVRLTRRAFRGLSIMRGRGGACVLIVCLDVSVQLWAA